MVADRYRVGSHIVLQQAIIPSYGECQGLCGQGRFRQMRLTFSATLLLYIHTHTFLARRQSAALQASRPLSLHEHWGSGI